MENNTATITIDNRFAIIPHWVIFSGISDGALRLYAVLAKYADGNTRQAFPSRTTLAKDLGKKSVRSIDGYMTELRNIGAVVVTHRKRAGTKENHTNIYTLRTLAPEVVQDSALPSAVDCAENKNHLIKTTLPLPPSFDEEINLTLSRSRSHSEPATNPHMRAREICHQIHQQDAWDIENPLWSELVDELNQLVGKGADIAHTLFNQGWFESLYRATGEAKTVGLGIATWVSKIVAYERQQPHVTRRNSKPAMDPWQV